MLFFLVKTASLKYNSHTIQAIIYAQVIHLKHTIQWLLVHRMGRRRFTVVCMEIITNK